MKENISRQPAVRTLDTNPRVSSQLSIESILQTYKNGDRTCPSQLQAVHSTIQMAGDGDLDEIIGLLQVSEHRLKLPRCIRQAKKTDIISISAAKTDIKKVLGERFATLTPAQCVEEYCKHYILKDKPVVDVNANAIIDAGVKGFNAVETKVLDIPEMGTIVIKMFKAGLNKSPKTLFWVSHGIQKEPKALTPTAGGGGNYAFLVPSGKNLLRTPRPKFPLVDSFLGEMAVAPHKYTIHGGLAPYMLIGGHYVGDLTESDMASFADLGVDLAIMYSWTWKKKVEEVEEMSGERQLAIQIFGADDYPHLGPVMDEIKKQFGYQNVIMHTCRSLAQDKIDKKAIEQDSGEHLHLWEE